ncbi:MAG: hypothetical protein MUF83_20455 [Acidimicrobiales bacterium]|jgi:hypothetical protein|nr:hypothetical protein [Acidimicrobiales bacterium]
MASTPDTPDDATLTRRKVLIGGAAAAGAAWVAPAVISSTAAAAASGCSLSVTFECDPVSANNFYLRVTTGCDCPSTARIRYFSPQTNAFLCGTTGECGRRQGLQYVSYPAGSQVIVSLYTDGGGCTQVPTGTPVATATATVPTQAQLCP